MPGQVRFAYTAVQLQQLLVAVTITLTGGGFYPLQQFYKKLLGSLNKQFQRTALQI